MPKRETLRRIDHREGLVAAALRHIHYLRELIDIKIDNLTLADGQAIVWKADDRLWVNGNVVGTGGGKLYGAGQLVYWMPGSILPGTQPMILMNRTRTGIDVYEMVITVDTPPLGGSVQINMAGFGSQTLAPGEFFAMQTFESPKHLARLGETYATVTIPGGVTPPKGVLVHLPYTYPLLATANETYP